MSVKDLKFILERVNVDPVTMCWNWKLGLHSEGYPRFRNNGKIVLGHRFVCELKHGPLQEDQVARHICHNRRCCNPAHILPGSQQENWNDSKDLHLKTAEKSRSKTGWQIGGVIYATLKQASIVTTLPEATICKYTNNGVFDLDAYRSGCAIGNKTPKI